MHTGLKEFGDIAKNLSGNPLGIIALFIVLVYGIAALVLGVSANTLQSFERLPMIWFLIIFPPIVLFTFTWLVARHHGKLYAPKDFSDPTHFLQTLNRDVQIKKLNEEVKSLEKETNNGVNKIDSQLKLPRKEIMTRVLISEELVIRELSSEFGLNINRQMGLGEDIGLDGMFAKGGKGFGIEVKLIRQIPHVYNAIKSLEEIITNINKYGWRNFDVILAAVIDDTTITNIDSIKDKFEKHLADSKMKITIKYFIFTELLTKYGIEI